MTRDREPKDAMTVIRLVPLCRADGTSDESAKEKRMCFRVLAAAAPAGARLIRCGPDATVLARHQHPSLEGVPMLRTALEGTLRRVKTPRNCSLSGAVLLVTILLLGS